MTDIFNSEKRSAIMSRIRARDTKPELLVRKGLHARGYRFRLHCKDLPGRPDIVLPKYRTVIFIHGCFWHSHNGCAKASIPKSNREFWLKKLDINQKRDQTDKTGLMSAGWRVLIVWGCACAPRQAETLLLAIVEFLKGTDQYREIGSTDIRLRVLSETTR